MPKDFNNWCPEVYRSVFIDRHNDDQLYVAPCCQAFGGTEKVENFDFNTSTVLGNIRAKFDQGIRAPECRLCWAAEDLGNKSRRQSAIEFFNIPPTNQVQLESIDHSSTWACNLACVMCGAKNSSTWAKELDLSKHELLNIGRQYQNQNSILGELDLQFVKKIHFNGGEPLLNNEQLDLLDKINVEKLFLSYNTNGTIFPSQRLIDLWSKTKLVKIFFSIDATEQAFNYIRYPGRWDQVSNNLLRMRDSLPSNVLFGFNVSVGAHNVLELASVIDWFNKNISTNREGDVSDFCTQFVHNYDMASLNTAAKQAALQSLEKYSQAEAVCNYLRTAQPTPMHWIDNLVEIDQRRGTDWRKHLNVAEYY